MGEAGSNEEEKRGGVNTVGGKGGQGARMTNSGEGGCGRGWMSAEGDRESGRVGGETGQ